MHIKLPALPTVSKTVKEIKALKIQGAERIAISAITAIQKGLENSKETDFRRLLTMLQNSKILLESARPTEPALRNSLNYIFNIPDTANDKIKQALLERCKQLLEEEKKWSETISSFGLKIIKQNLQVYTHCHSTEVVKLIRTAKQAGLDFSVNNTETRPLYQGRITATEISNIGVPVNYYEDNAMLQAIKNSDIILLGCDAVTEKGIYNKIGSGIIGIVAMQLRKPLIICAPSWKYSKTEPIIEERDDNEVWPKHPAGIKVHNPAFELVPKQQVSKVISEFGMQNFNEFYKAAKKKWEINLK